MLSRDDFHVTRTTAGEAFGHPRKDCVLHFAQGMTTGCSSTEERLIGVCVIATVENVGDLWWAALRAHPRGTELVAGIKAGLIAPADFAELKALPGWKDGLLVV